MCRDEWQCGDGTGCERYEGRAGGDADGLKAMKAAGVLDNAEIRIVLSGDEERHGEPVSVSRKDMIDAAKKSDVALEFEAGGILTARRCRASAGEARGAGEMETTGRTGHSSQVFSERMGDGAVYELARILDEFRRELREPGLTYNVGLVLGGATATMNANGTGGEAMGKTNVVPPVALAHGDMRTLDNEQTSACRRRCGRSWRIIFRGRGDDYV